MCGIAGIIGNENLVKESTLKSVAESLAHRGPDDEGTGVLRVDRNKLFGLVHRRLSIIDLSEAAHQPMQDEKNGNWIVFNGEIYNYQEVKESLVAKGFSFKTNSDTEVILKSYAAYGDECLEKLRGMFAFALWDNKRRRVFISVDRFGIKPLYYSKKSDGTFVFASEVRALIQNNLVEKRVNPQAVDSYLAYGSIQAPLTIIDNLFALLPGHSLSYDVDKDEVNVNQYWGIQSAASLTESRSVEELLADSVNVHLTSDVPLGIFLSGGVDSSSLAILTNRASRNNGLQSFSIAFSEKEYSEGKYSKIIGQKYCDKHHEIYISESDLDGMLPKALDSMDQPSIDGINTYVIAKAVRDREIKAVLSGQGGDEVFGGYHTFKRVPFFNKMSGIFNRLPHSLRSGTGNLAMKMCGDSIFSSKISQILKSNGSPMDLYFILRQLYSQKTRQRIMNRDDVTEMSEGLHLKAREWLSKESEGLDIFSAVSLLEMRLYLANTLLRDGDVMSMAHGLEIRVPFLDHKLLGGVLSEHPDNKIDKKMPKPLLIDAVQKELPTEIYMRPKMGFTFPWEIWLRNKLKTKIDEIIQRVDGGEGLGLNMGECRRLWNAFLDKKPEVTWSRIWALYVISTWYEKNISA